MNTFELLFPDFSLILCGYLVCRYTALNRKVWEQVESLVYFFLLPVLLFHSIVKAPLDLGSATHLIGAALLLTLCGIALSYTLAWLPSINKADHAASAQVAFRFNSFIALAIAERVTGREGLLLVALMIGVCVPVCNVGAVWPMARRSERGFLRELLRNPLILATAGGLLANIAGFRMPIWLEPGVTRIGSASLALGLMAAGAGMQITQLKSAKILGVSVLVVRHFLMPLVALNLCLLLSLTPVQSTVLLVFSALPTASSAYVLASRMGHNAALVAALVTASTLLSMLSLPFALQVLKPML